MKRNRDKRAGRDARCRNRKQGTKKRGRGRDNWMRIPDRWQGALLPGQNRILRRSVHGFEMPFIIEKTRPGRFHPCHVDDVARLLNLLPKEHVICDEQLPSICGVFFWQPTRKQQMLHSVWGRLGYVDWKWLKTKVIILPSQKFPQVLTWDRRMSPYWRREAERFELAGARHRMVGRKHRFAFDGEALRNSVLFHTVPHEVGHAVHYERFIYREAAREAGSDFEFEMELWDRRSDLYDSIPWREKEEYAHRYAEEQMDRLRRQGKVPFPSRMSAAALRKQGLDPADFLPEAEEAQG